MYEATFLQRADENEGEARFAGQVRLAEYTRYAGLQIKVAEVLNLHGGRQPRDMTPHPDVTTRSIIEAIRNGALHE